MTAGVREIKVRFSGDAKGLAAASQQGSKALSGWRASTVAFGAAAGLALQKAAQLAVQLGRDSVAAFAEAEAAQRKLQDAFDRFPRLADTNIERLRALNEQLMNKTRFDDDAFASGQAVLAQYGLTGRQLERLTPLLADYAAKTGKDLPTAAGVLGKAFLGNTRALKDLGINYKSTGNRAKDIANITRLVQARVGGFAEKEGTTAAGKAAILSNKFGELKEQIGAKLLPVLLRLADIGLKTADWIGRNKDIIGPLAAVIATVVAVQWAWNVAMAANPIGLIIIGIAALIAAIVFVATKTRFFQTLWEKAWGGIKAAALAVGRWFRDTLWPWIQGVVLAIHTKFVALRDTLKAVFDRVRGIIRGAFQAGLDAARSAINAILGLINNSIRGVNVLIRGLNKVPGVNIPQLPQLPSLDRGGRIAGAGLARVHKDETLFLPRGAEVIPRQQSLGLGAGGLVIENHIEIGGEVVRVVRSEISQANRQLRRRVLAGTGSR